MSPPKFPWVLSVLMILYDSHESHVSTVVFLSLMSSQQPPWVSRVPMSLSESHESHESTVVFLSLMSLSESHESPLVGNSIKSRMNLT